MSVLVDTGLAERNGFSATARVRSLRFALRGVRAMIQSQHNAWIHAVATLLAVAAAAAFGIGRFEWLAVTLVILAVWTAEALNTAFEALCDVASPEFHPAVARAKDIAAGAVLISALGSLVVAGIVFAPRLLALVG